MARTFTVFCLLLITVIIAADPVAKPHEFAGGQPISASQMNANFDALYDVLSGQIDGANLKSNVGIGTAYPTGLFQVQSQKSTGTGQLSSGGTDVVGIGTSFMTELSVGDEIIAAGQSRIVTSISANNTFAVDAAFEPVLSNVAFQYSSPSILVTDTGNVGIGTADPSEMLEVNGNLFVSGGDIKTDRWLNSDTNTFIGVGAAGAGNLSHTIGSQGWGNTSVGFSTLHFNTIGRDNTGVGSYALWNNTTGFSNIAIGGNTLQNNTTGFDNTASGRSALFYNTTGGGNTGIGRNALFYVNPTEVGEGENNVGIGYYAGQNLTTGSNNIIIGANVDAPSATGNDQLNIGNTIYGDFSNGNVGIGTVSPSQKLEVAGTIKSTGIQIGTTTTAGHVLTADASGVGTWQVASSGGSHWSESGGNLYRSTGSVGIGTSEPGAYTLNVNGSTRVYPAGNKGTSGAASITSC